MRQPSVARQRLFVIPDEGMSGSVLMGCGRKSGPLASACPGRGQRKNLSLTQALGHDFAPHRQPERAMMAERFTTG